MKIAALQMQAASGDVETNIARIAAAAKDAAAEGAKADLVAAGYTAAYTRCVGSNEECG